jgi:hypothetical protein
MQIKINRMTKRFLVTAVGIWTLVFLMVLISFFSFAQMPDRFLEIGMSGNSYKGDLSSGYYKWAGGYHFGILLNRKKRLNGHFNLMIGNIVAQNPDYYYDNGAATPPSPNKFSNTRLITVNYDLHINLVKRSNFIFYLYQGIGAMRFDPRDTDNNKLLDQLNSRAKNETYSNITIFFPHGIGALYTLKQGYGVGLQTGFINPASDYLDNISQWGTVKKKDNILTFKLTLYAPLNFSKSEKKTNSQKTSPSIYTEPKKEVQPPIQPEIKKDTIQEIKPEEPKKDTLENIPNNIIPGSNIPGTHPDQLIEQKTEEEKPKEQIINDPDNTPINAPGSKENTPNQVEPKQEEQKTEEIKPVNDGLNH